MNEPPEKKLDIRFEDIRFVAPGDVLPTDERLSDAKAQEAASWLIDGMEHAAKQFTFWRERVLSKERPVGICRRTKVEP